MIIQVKNFKINYNLDYLDDLLESDDELKEESDSPLKEKRKN